MTVAVTPLTKLAVRRAESGGLETEKIDNANAMISQLLGNDIIETCPVDATDKEGCGEAEDDSQIQYALLLAAL